MKIVLRYLAQLRHEAGVESEALELKPGADLQTALAQAAAGHSPNFRALLLDEKGTLRRSLLVLVNGVPAGQSGDGTLSAGDEITLLPPLGGG